MSGQAPHAEDARAEYEQARASAALFDSSDRGKVEVAGPDAPSFLHNLCTNDVRGLPPDAGCEAFFCTATAKVVAHALIFRSPPEGRDERFRLDLAPGLSARLLKHLDHYLISEQVELADRTPDFAQLHLAGPQAPAVLARVAGAEVALELLRQRTLDLAGPCTVRRTDALGLPGYDLLCPADHAGEVRRRLTDAGARPAGRQVYEILRVEAGTPLYGIDVDETTFAPEVGRKAISYTKGCYLGQEPIVMARDRGQVNRALLGVKLPDGVVPPGSLLHRDGTEVGRVTSGVVSPRLGPVGLAYVRRGHQAPGTLLEVDVGGRRGPAEVAALPFAVPQG